MENLIKPALDKWLEATSPYCEPRDGTDDEHLQLINATRDLIEAIRDATPINIPEETPRDLHSVVEALDEARTHIHEHAWTIRQNIIGLSGIFLFGTYGDDDTDAPCDVEWDCENLMEELFTGYTFDREYVQPSYVLTTAYTAAPDTIDG